MGGSFLKIVSIHQPQYFPWLGLMSKIIQSDFFVFLDDVQFNRRGFQNRALYSTDQGNKYLTIPVKKDKRDIQINQLQFANESEGFLKKHFESLRHRYSKTEGWIQAKDRIEEFMLGEKYESVCDLIIRSMLFTLKLFEVDIPYIKSSTLKCEGHKDELMLNITKKVKGDIYLSGQGAKVYMRDEIFLKEGIKVWYQAFEHPIYSQSHGNGFFDGSMALDFYFEHPTAAINWAKKVKQNRYLGIEKE